MSSGYMGADATGTLPVQFCQKCGQALGTSWSIEGGLNFHPWCAPSVTRHHAAWSEDCNKTNLKVEELLDRIAELEAENERLQIAYDVQKAATCQFVIVSAEDGPKAVDEGMAKAYQVASEQKSRANDAEAELAALKARIIQAHFYRLPVIALDVETDEGGVHWIDGMSAAEVLAIVHDDVPAPVYESVPRTVSDGWKQAEAEFNRMSITYVHECARLKIRAEQAEAENKALQAERDNVPNVIALMKRAKKAEAEREAIAKSLQACGNYTGYMMYVEQRDRVDEAETELATLKWKLDYLVAEFSDVGKVPVSGIREDLEEAWTAREGTP